MQFFIDKFDLSASSEVKQPLCSKIGKGKNNCNTYYLNFTNTEKLEYLLIYHQGEDIFPIYPSG